MWEGLFSIRSIFHFTISQPRNRSMIFRPAVSIVVPIPQL